MSVIVRNEEVKLLTFCKVSCLRGLQRTLVLAYHELDDKELNEEFTKGHELKKGIKNHPLKIAKTIREKGPVRGAAGEGSHGAAGALPEVAGEGSRGDAAGALPEVAEDGWRGESWTCCRRELE
ncbi:hypothetical protein HHK36_024355 [Tetracentron sinense]|uniref:Uncharacterized protein n=1 Tax=Tetracentron sinense TaxID=13715 RepID=A0A835D4K1_TETSI|nr:hypothetical protein HHK36_024355 [Tetracentron sinense]